MRTPARWAAPLLAALVVAAPALAQTAASEVVLEAGGALMAGTAWVGVGQVDDGEPVPPVGLDPVSHAAHGFAVAGCDAFMEVALAYGSAAGRALGDEPAVLQVSLRDDAGETVAAWLATDGSLHAGTDEALAPGDHALHLHHVLGPRVAYNVTATAWFDC